MIGVCEIEVLELFSGTEWWCRGVSIIALLLLLVILFLSFWIFLLPFLGYMIGFLQIWMIACNLWCVANLCGFSFWYPKFLFYLFLSDIIFVLKCKSFCFIGILFWFWLWEASVLKHVSIISKKTLCCILFNTGFGLFNSNFIFNVLLVCNSVFQFFCQRVWIY